MSSEPLEYLRHILAEADYLSAAATNVSKEEFLESDTLRRAFVRSLEIIGEATKKMPEAFREQHAGVDWRAMAGMRDRLIHGYFGVDYELVWDVVKRKIPEVRKHIQEMADQMGRPRDGGNCESASS